MIASQERIVEIKKEFFLLVPKLLLGNPIWCEALLCSKASNPSVTFLSPSWSLASMCVPKLELGNERK